MAIHARFRFAFNLTVACFFPVAFAGFAVWMVISDPEIMPMDFAAISVKFGLLFGLVGTGIGCVVFRLLNKQVNIIDGSLGVTFFLSLLAAWFGFKSDGILFLVALIVCGTCIAYFTVRAAMGN